MFDARYLAFATLAAMLVISPGATLAVVVGTALGEGRKAALLTVLGVGVANASLALASAFGLSLVFQRWPAALHAVRFAGAIYLGCLGSLGLWRALSSKAETGPGPFSVSATFRPRARPGASSWIARGVVTNLLNPPVLVFYVTVVPQFIGPQDPFLPRFLLLGATHVAMSVAWQGSCGLAVGAAADHMARPAVRRALEGITGAVLIALAARLLL